MKDTNNEAIRSMVAEYGSPYGFYRAVYKGTDCGPSVGMRFDNHDRWVYGDDLPTDEESCQHITGIGASSIVEGSDVEIEFREANSEEEFWKNLEDINEEACFYWKRDNTDSLIIKYRDMEVFASWTQFDDDPVWDNEQVPKELVVAAFNAYWEGLSNEFTFAWEGGEVSVELLLDDSGF